MGDALLFALGLTLLTLGADWLVRGSAQLAKRLGVSNLVVGLTVVAFGTSAPELVVTGAASLAGDAGIAVGNVMGSTAANVGLIVGLGALIRPIGVHRRLVVRETPLVIFVLTIVMVLSLNDALGRLDGLALVSGWSLYLLFLLRWGDDFEAAGWEPPEPTATSTDPAKAVGDDAPVTVEEVVAARTGTAEPDGSAAPTTASSEMEHGLWWALIRIGVGLPSLMYGAKWLLDSAEAIAYRFEIPEAVIAATMIAVGTSLPELASTLAAAFRGMGDMAIGNVIGSNVFNLGLVLGTAALLRPLELPPSIVVQYVLPALAFSVLLIPLALTGQRVNRWEGGLLLALYIGFVSWLLVP
ncbi:MAG: calcium/sodium antiporter [Gemmatimonadetes bacterium]|nr:calcium/sodium antiporter [Gemmatimonadota bacterium]